MPVGVAVQGAGRVVRLDLGLWRGGDLLHGGGRLGGLHDGACVDLEGRRGTPSGEGSRDTSTHNRPSQVVLGLPLREQNTGSS